MKKIIVLTVAALLVLSLGVIAFAETENETPSWFTEMIKWKKDQVQKAMQNEQITEEQAKYWNERIDSMEKFHSENGFNYPAGCGGCGRGTGRGPGKGFGGFGPRMKNRFNNTNVTNNSL